MGKPTVNITIEPSEGGSVVYSPLAAPNSNGKLSGQLSLVLKIENPDTPDTVNLHLSKVEVLSPTSHLFDVDLNIAKGFTSVWNTIVDYPKDAPPINQNIILPFPPPNTITVNLYFDGFTDPATVTKSLLPYSDKTPEGSYAFPGAAGDLGPGEFWAGSSAVHGSGTNGMQLFAYDLGVIGWDSERNSWSWLRPGTKELEAQKKLHNEHYRVWRKPVYAMSQGEVLEFAYDRPDNPNPGRDPCEFLPESQGVINGAGNYFNIRHGNEIVAYCHMRNGSVNTNLCFEGAQVNPGDFLGEAGNSGTSCGPHLHIDLIKGDKPRDGFPLPICFHNISVLEQDLLEPGVLIWNIPWVKVYGQGLPAWPSAIYPVQVEELPNIEIEKWMAIIHIIFGGTMDAGGLGRYPSGKPIPIGPWDPLRHLSPAKRDILLGLALTEVASIANDSKSKSGIEKVGIEVITNAVKKLKPL